jgi:NADPH:quinone reductase-like Zn-dependent oxidoreductase
MTSSIPTTTAGVTIAKTGGTEVLEYSTSLSLAPLKPGQVLVKNEFIGINYIDTYFRTGLYPAPSFPYILGREASGVVVAASPDGDTYGLKAGDRVVYMADGTYAQYVNAPASKTVVIPDGVETKEAAAALLQALTAWTLIHDAHAVQAGDWILVHAAAGGVGQWLVQMLKHVGAKVIATCSTTKVEVVKGIGADVVVDYTKEDFVARVKEVTQGAGVPAVFDSVGKSTFDGSLECVALRGTMVSFGNASGTPEPLVIA